MAKLTLYEQKIVELGSTHQAGMAELERWLFRRDLSADYATSCDCQRCYLEMHPSPLAAEE